MEWSQQHQIRDAKRHVIDKNTHVTTSNFNYLSIGITIVKSNHVEKEIRVTKASSGIKSCQWDQKCIAHADLLVLERVKHDSLCNACLKIILIHPHVFSWSYESLVRLSIRRNCLRETVNLNPLRPIVLCIRRDFLTEKM